MEPGSAGLVNRVRAAPQEFERDLEAIEAKVIELFAMVAEDLPEATEALLTGDNDVIRVLRERDQVIDALYPEIEELVNREILLQAPVASDLRFLLSVLRIVPELEPLASTSSMSIAARANHILSDDLSPRCRGLVERMGDPGLRACGARPPTPGTSATARPRSRSAERDDEMDELHASLIAELASGRMTLPVTMEMTLVARFYERLGDHAVNIARRVVYLAGSSAELIRRGPRLAGAGSAHPAGDVGLGAAVPRVLEDLLRSGRTPPGRPCGCRSSRPAAPSRTRCGR